MCETMSDAETPDRCIAIPQLHVDGRPETFMKLNYFKAGFQSFRIMAWRISVPFQNASNPLELDSSGLR